MALLLDITGFEALFRVNYQSLCATAYRIVLDRDIAEDIVQDVFRKLWKKRNSIKLDSSLKAYLWQGTISQSLNYMKKFGDPQIGGSLFDTGERTDITVAWQLMSLKETNQKVDGAVRSLPEACRVIFVLSRYERLSYDEIARKLDIPLKTVSDQMLKALKHLRACLLV